MKITCATCRRTFDVPVSNEQVQRWIDGELIQRVMPELSDAQRELFVSMTCGDCFDEMFAESV